MDGLGDDRGEKVGEEAGNWIGHNG
jgi:hypothetical protein